MAFEGMVSPVSPTQMKGTGQEAEAVAGDGNREDQGKEIQKLARE
jgi:hypothetical protein